MKKLFTVFIGTVLLILNCAAQQTPLGKKITVDYKQQQLHSILNDLGTTHGFEFSYANDQLPLSKKVSVKAVNEPAQAVFERLFTPLQISFVPVGKKIVLKQNRAAATPAKKEEATNVHQTIRGVVLNKDTRQPLVGATVTLQGTSTKYALTDEEGTFRFSQVPVGRQDLEITMSGYQKAALSGLLVNSAKEAVINVEMVESAHILEGVTVKHRKDRQRASNEMATVSARSFTVEETSRYAASVFDPARMALSFAGVAASDDLSNELVIRGNSPKGVLWRLEGVEISNPNHFTDEGSSGGGVSMISSSMLDNSDFYTGAFPAEYGNALSGVFDLKFRKGNKEKREHAFMIGLLGTEASIEGPFKKGGGSSYLVNYRYSTLSLLKKIGMNPVNNGAVPEYQDLAFNLNFPTKRAGTFSLFGIGGTSSQVTEGDKNADKWETFWDRMNTDFRYRSASAGITHEIHTGANSYLRSVLSYSGSRNNENMDSLDNQYQPQLFGRDRYTNQTLRLSTLFNTRLSSRNLVRTGVIYSHYFFDFNSVGTRRSQNVLIDYLNDRGNTGMVQAYAQWRHRIGNVFTVNTGLHSSMLALSKKPTIEPRLGMEWNINQDQSVTFGAGIHSRMEPLVLYYGRTRLPDGTHSRMNTSLPLTKASHLVLGYNKRLQKNLKLKAEVYYQHLFDAPIAEDTTVILSSLNSNSGYMIYDYNFGALAPNGKGRNYGVELSLERALNNGFYFMVNASLYNSLFTAGNGKEFNTRFNGNYINNLVTGKEFKVGGAKRNLIGINTKLIWRGGMRYSPIDEETSKQQGETVFYKYKTNTIRSDDYIRMDLSFSYRINKPRFTHSFFIDIQNTLNRRNVQTVIYDVDKQKQEKLYHAGLVPSVYYRIEF